MRETVRDRGRIEDMLEMALKLKNAPDNHNLEDINRDPILFYGLTKMVEIIGEAAYMLTDVFKATHPELPWRKIIGMRHVLVHGYNTVSPLILWDVITHDIPPMIPILIGYLERPQDEG